jgi:hypothetical protein
MPKKNNENLRHPNENLLVFLTRIAQWLKLLQLTLGREQPPLAQQITNALDRWGPHHSNTLW